MPDYDNWKCGDPYNEREEEKERKRKKKEEIEIERAENQE